MFKKIISQHHYDVNNQIPTFAAPEAAARDRDVRALVERAVWGDLANWPLESISGRLLVLGCTWQGAQMWRDIIALRRAALVTLPAGLMVEVW